MLSEGFSGFQETGFLVYFTPESALVRRKQNQFLRLFQDGTQTYQMQGLLRNYLLMHKTMFDLLKMNFKFQLNGLV